MARIPRAYTYVRVNHSKLSEVKALYDYSYGVSPSIDGLIAKYDTTVLGLDFIGCIAYSEQYEPAAYYGVFPLRFSIRGVETLAAQSGDTMTSPTHRMKGLFVESALRAYALAARSGVKFVFGFPNENSFPGFKSKLSWQFHGTMFNAVLNCRAIPLAAFAKRFGKWINRSCSQFLRSRIQKYSVLVKQFDPRQIQGASDFSVLRDEAFLGYKKSNGAVLVDVDGFQMMVRIDGALLVGEVVQFPPEQYESFIKAVTKLARIAFCHKVIFSFSGHHWLNSLFFDHGHRIQSSLPIGFLPLGEFQADWADCSFTRLDYDTF